MSVVRDWGQYPNFAKHEFDCSHTGDNQMREDFMALLQELRTAYGKPMTVSSGFRSAKHPIEARKDRPGTHASGYACDIAVQGAEAVELLRLALDLGFTGIGVQQKGSGRFIHLDLHPRTAHVPRPAIWSY
jgi:zinc D-Ala-D-Ala carboxypeptidase